MTHDGLGKYLKEKITKAPGKTADIVQILKDTHTDVVVSYLPVGSEQATKWYVEQVLEAGCGFVNCIPVFIAREDYWNDRFKKAGLPIVGDDIKSQVGATIVHRALARLFHDRGVKMLRTSQLNVGGNMDFYNMLERERLESKKISKTNAVTSIMGHTLPEEDVYIGPSDYVPWLTDRKWAHIRVEGQAFGDVPLNVEMKLEVWDSPNSAGIVIDAVRCCKLALNHGVGGQLDGPSSYLMKSPHTQRPDDEAREETEKFIAKHARAARHKAASGRRRRRRPRRRANRLRLLGPPAPGSGASALRFSPRGRELQIAQVTPYAWEAGHEVNPTSSGWRPSWRAGPSRGRRRAVALARLVRETRAAVRRRAATACCPRPATGRGARRRRGAAASARRAAARAGCRSTSPARSRTLSTASPLDFVHVHEPWAPSAAERGAAPLARAERRHVPRARPSGSSRPSSRGASWSSFFGRLDARMASLRRHARADARASSPPTTGSSCRAPTRRPRRRALDGDAVRIVFVDARSAAALRLFLRALRRLPADARWRPLCVAPAAPRRPPAAPRAARAHRVSRPTRRDGRAARGADVAVSASIGRAPAPGGLVRALGRRRRARGGSPAGLRGAARRRRAGAALRARRRRDARRAARRGSSPTRAARPAARRRRRRCARG